MKRMWRGVTYVPLLKTRSNFLFLDDLSDQNLEELWLKLRPKRLTRDFGELIIGTVYHPPKADNKTMLEYLMRSISSIEAQFPNCGTTDLGDFNQLYTEC